MKHAKQKHGSLIGGFNPHAEVLHVQFLEYANSQNRLSDLLHGDAEPWLQCWVWTG